MQKTTRYRIPQTVPLREIVRELRGHYSLKRDKKQRAHFSFFDTFDWRLFRAGFQLVRTGEWILLQKREDGSTVETISCQVENSPKFWWEFPPGDCREKLGSLLDVRALLKLVTVEEDFDHFRILNRDRKTVLHVFAGSVHLIEQESRQRICEEVRVAALRGYQQEAGELEKFLRSLGCLPAKKTILNEALEISGYQPGRYSSKLDIQLTPEMTLGQAGVKIFTYLAQVIRQNETGILADTDSEFLHDFRVAIRRTRSALGQIKEIFPENISQKFKSDFAEIQKQTNRLRDLDVYLLNKDTYREFLPEEIRPGLDLLFGQIARERKSELKKVVRLLKGNFYGKTMQEWENFLQTYAPDEHENTGNRETPVKPAAQKFILKKYRQVLKIGSRIDDGTPDSELHRLRIECKKLRYLLEFFASLFPPAEMKKLIGQLKKLQDNLGEFNDYSVQRQRLEDFWKEKLNDQTHSPQIAVAVGGLVTQLYQLQKEARRDFSEIFRNFSRKKNRAIYQNLFAAKKSDGGSS